MPLSNKRPQRVATDRLWLAHGRWREAAGLVWARWFLFLAAESDSRASAFDAYLAALDAEETEAARLAGLLLEDRRLQKPEFNRQPKDVQSVCHSH